MYIANTKRYKQERTLLTLHLLKIVMFPILIDMKVTQHIQVTGWAAAAGRTSNGGATSFCAYDLCKCRRRRQRGHDFAYHHQKKCVVQSVFPKKSFDVTNECAEQIRHTLLYCLLILNQKIYTTR